MKKKLLKVDSWLFLLVFFASCIFRVSFLDLIEFKTDEAVNIFLASRPLFGHPFPPGSTVSSVGILNPPLLNYLLFPLTLISIDPRFITFVIALLNSIAVAFFALIIKKYHNKTLAVITGLIFAFSPWAIIYSRKIWTQDLIVPFLIPFIYSVYKILIDNEKKYWLVFSFFSALLIQLHQSSLFFIALIMFLLMINKTKINIKYLTIGALVGFVPLIPYLIYQLNNNCPDCIAILTANQRMNNSYQLSIFARPLQIVGKGNFQSILGNDTLTFSQNFPLIYSFQKIFYLEYLLLPLGAFLFWKRYKRMRLIVYSTFLLPVLYFTLKIEPLTHYFIISLLFLLLFLSFGIYSIINKNKILGIVIFVTLITYSIIYNLSFFSILNSQKGLKGDYGTAFITSWKDKEKSIKEFRNRKDYEEILLTSFIPNNLIYGFLPLGNIIYSPKEKKESDISHLDYLMKKNPKDPRIQKEILSYYTKSIPTKTILKKLKSKTNIKNYEKIYKEVYSVYYAKNLKREFRSNFGFGFDYPEHWKVKHVTETENILTVDNYALIFSTEEIAVTPNKNYSQIESLETIIGEKTIKKTCKTKDNKWCGISYSPIKIAGQEISIAYDVVDRNYPNFDKKTQELILSIDDVVKNIEL